MQELTTILTQADQVKSESQKNTIALLQQNEQLANSLVEHISYELNKDVRTAHENQQKIDKLLAQNVSLTQRLLKQQTKWISQYDLLLNGLKECGDLVNWSEIIQKDLDELNHKITL